MYISSNFTLEELLVSNHSKEYPEQLKPNQVIIDNLIYLVNNVLQPLRDLYGKPLKITSAWRCPRVNKAVGGSKTSAHVNGYAADIQCDDNYGLFLLICKNLKQLKVDQVIHEHGTDGNPAWVHVGTAVHPRNQILIARKTKPYYTTITLDQAIALRKLYT